MSSSMSGMSFLSHGKSLDTVSQPESKTLNQCHANNNNNNSYQNDEGLKRLLVTKSKSKPKQPRPLQVVQHNLMVKYNQKQLEYESTLSASNASRDV